METKEFNRLIGDIKDAQSFDILYNYYYKKIVLRLKYIYGESLAQEVAQDFFMGLINKNGEGWGNIGYPTSWVYKCCENLAKKKNRERTADLTIKSGSIIGVSSTVRN